jgi:cytochrome b6-f complex iron-sulfur subunit
VLGGIALLEYIWLAVQFLRPRPAPRKAGSEGVVIAGPVERFERGSVTAFPQGRFYLARLEDGGFLALHRECTHLGCTVPWIADQGRFICPCHASAFDLRGVVENPPAPRPLDLFAVRIENGIVKVDTSTPVRRSSFSASQAVRA